MAQAVKEYLSTYPAVRLQHDSRRPVGKGLEAWQDSDGATWLKALVVDPVAQKLVRKGVLTAYSVGIAEPKTRSSLKCSRWEIYGGRLMEVSLVDHPSNTRCGIQIAKSIGGIPTLVNDTYRVTKSGKVKLNKSARAAESQLEKALGQRALTKAERSNGLAVMMLDRIVRTSDNPVEREYARIELHKRMAA